MKTRTSTKRATRRLAASLAIITALATSGALAHTTVGNTTGKTDVCDETGRSESGYYVIGFTSGATGIVNNVSGTLSVGMWMAVGWKTGSYGELNIKSGEVAVNGANSGTGVFVGYDSSAEGHLVVDGGSLNVKNDFIVGRNGTGTLTINGGTVEVGSSTSEKWTKLGDASGVTGTINLNGGKLKLAHLRRGNNGSKGTLVFNGGTLVANKVSNYGLIDSGLPVTVNAGGGAIDCNGLSVSIAATLSGTGGLTFTGGSTITINGAVSYSGATAVTPGTVLAIANSTAKTNILKNGLVLAGSPTADQTIVTYTSAFEDADLAKVSCSLAPTTTFKFTDETKTAIAVDTPGPALDNCWTGAVDNDLSNDANWSSGTKPTGNANIFCATPATLTKGATFAPTSITFLEGSAPVTIDGDTAFENITEIVSRSSASHTINVPVRFTGDIQVKQAAMAETGDLTKPHVTFAGSAYAAAGCALESGNSAAVYSRCIFGKYYLASTSASRWTAQYQSGSKRVCVAPDSYLSVPYAGNVSELYVGNGAKVDIGDMNTSGRPSCQVYGEMVVTNIAMTGSSGNTFMTYNQGTTPGVYKFETVTNAKTGGSFAFSDHNASSKHVFYIGAGGINFSGTVGGYYIIGNNKGGAQSETIRPWHSDFTIADRGNSGAALDLYGKVEFCTDDENDVERAITIAAITTSHASGALTVSGKGTVLVTNTHTGESPSVTVKDTATLEFGSNGSLGNGAITLGAGTTLALTATSKEFSPLANTLNLPTTGTATIRIDGARLKSGYQEIATVGTGATANVALDPESPAIGGRRASLRVEDGKIVLNIIFPGTLIIVR